MYKIIISLKCIKIKITKSFKWYIYAYKNTATFYQKSLNFFLVVEIKIKNNIIFYKNTNLTFILENIFEIEKDDKCFCICEKEIMYNRIIKRRVDDWWFGSRYQLMLNSIWFWEIFVLWVFYINFIKNFKFDL